MPFILALTRDPSGAATTISPQFAMRTDDDTPLNVRKNFITKIDLLKRPTKAAKEEASAYYKVDYVANIRRQLQFTTDYMIHVGKPPTSG